MNLYLTLKALHLIAVISWMAGFCIFQEFLCIILKKIVKKI